MDTSHVELNRRGLTKVADHVWVKISRTQGGSTSYQVLPDGLPATTCLNEEQMVKVAEEIADDYSSRLSAHQEKIAEHAATDAAEAVVRAAADRLATERQISLIMRLIARGAHEEGGFMTGPITREGVSALTKREASAYIDSLTDRY